MPNKYIFDKELFALRLKQARKAKNYKQNAFSEILDVNVNTLSKWENGKNKLMPGYQNLIAILNELDIDPAFLFLKDDIAAFLFLQDDIKMDFQGSNPMYSIIENLTEKEKNIILTLIISLMENRQGETIG